MISFGFISMDIILIIILVALLSLISYKKGKKILVSLILSAYPAILIFDYLPFIEIDGSGSKALIFVVIYIVLFILSQKYIHVKKNHSMQRKWIDSVLLSLSFVVLILSIYVYAVPSLTSIYSLSSSVVGLITNIPYGLGLIIPIVVLFFTNKRESI